MRRKERRRCSRSKPKESERRTARCRAAYNLRDSQFDSCESGARIRNPELRGVAMASRIAVSVALAALALCATACGSSSKPAESSSAPAADASHAEHTGASRVFFVEPKDGATIK